MADLRISHLFVQPAGPASRARGTLAFVSFIAGGELRLDGLVVRLGRESQGDTEETGEQEGGAASPLALQTSS